MNTYNPEESLIDSQSILDVLECDEDNDDQINANINLTCIIKKISDGNNNVMDLTFSEDQSQSFIIQSPPELKIIVMNKFYNQQFQTLIDQLQIRVKTDINNNLEITYTNDMDINHIKFSLSQFFESILYQEIKSDVSTLRTIISSTYIREGFKKMNIEIIKVKTGNFIQVYFVTRSIEKFQQITQNFRSIFRGTRLFLKSMSIISRPNNNNLQSIKVRVKYFKKFYDDYLREQIDLINFIEIVNESDQFVSIVIGCQYEINQKNSFYIQDLLTKWLIQSLKSLLHFTITSNSLTELRKLENIFNNTKIENQFRATSIIINDKKALIVIGNENDLINIFEYLINDCNNQKFELSQEFLEGVKITINKDNVDYSINQNQIKGSAFEIIKQEFLTKEILRVNPEQQDLIISLTQNFKTFNLIKLCKFICEQKYNTFGKANLQSLQELFTSLKENIPYLQSTNLFEEIQRFDQTRVNQHQQNPFPVNQASNPQTDNSSRGPQSRYPQYTADDNQSKQIGSSAKQKQQQGQLQQLQQPQSQQPQNNNLIQQLSGPDQNVSLHLQNQYQHFDQSIQYEEGSQKFQQQIIKKLQNQKGNKYKCELSEQYKKHCEDKIFHINNLDLTLNQDNFAHLFVKMSKKEALDLHQFGFQLKYYETEELILKELKNGEEYLEVLANHTAERINQSQVLMDSQKNERLTTFQLQANSVFPRYLHKKMQD